MTTLQMPMDTMGNGHGSERPLRVLIVEDEALIAMDLEDILSDNGCEVVGAANSTASAMREAGRGGADIAFMDVDILGPTDGVETARAIRSAYGIPSIFVTANNSEDFRRRTRFTCPLGYVDKPFAASSILAALMAARARLILPSPRFA